MLLIIFWDNMPRRLLITIHVAIPFTLPFLLKKFGEPVDTDLFFLMLCFSGTAFFCSDSLKSIFQTPWGYSSACLYLSVWS